MIPKIIHYCWFGRGEMPELVLHCIDSWKRYLPDYEIRLWNEGNFDVTLYQYSAEAYKERKYAFVSDVCRLYALKEFGGVYLDTDVQMLKTLDEFLFKHTAFSGIEDNNYLTSGLMASTKGGQWVTDLLALYDNRRFRQIDGSLDMTTNVEMITSYMKNRGLVIQNSFQEIEGYCAIYPSEYFCPKSWKTQEINITTNTYCIHHFAGSWLPSRKKWNKYEFLLKLVGAKNFERLAAIKRKFKS
ncbi:glycosyltransferase family 32 protein [Sphingobacterium thalpophilum]|uniref:glycosyltransferase family 32 protein n=1 Tax=Sphingobacterium thalpophilum TaxID=259 RepID=UPI003C779B2B